MEVLNERLKEIVDTVKKDLGAFDIFTYVKEILQLVNLDEDLRCDIEDWQGKAMVFKASDTGRSISINFTDGNVIGQIGKRDDAGLKFEATEKTFLELLSGDMDPDSAFFRRKIRITGPIVDALKFKNIFFSKCMAK